MVRWLREPVSVRSWKRQWDLSHRSVRSEVSGAWRSFYDGTGGQRACWAVGRCSGRFLLASDSLGGSRVKGAACLLRHAPVKCHVVHNRLCACCRLSPLAFLLGVGAG